MFGWSDLTWNRIREEILYHTPCLIDNVIGYVITSLIISYIQPIWDRINGEIYYPFFFNPFYMGYVNHMLRYEIYISHVS